MFPFRAQWTSPTELLYTADGKIKTRGRLRGGDADADRVHRGGVVHAHTLQAAVRDFDSRAPQPVRGIMAPVISPDGTQVAFARSAICG